MSQETNGATGAKGQASLEDWFCFLAAHPSGEEGALFPPDSQARWMLLVLPAVTVITANVTFGLSFQLQKRWPELHLISLCVRMLLEDFWVKIDMDPEQLKLKAMNSECADWGTRIARILLWGLLLHLVHWRWVLDVLGGPLCCNSTAHCPQPLKTQHRWSPPASLRTSLDWLLIALTEATMARSSSGHEEMQTLQTRNDELRNQASGLY